MTKTPVYIAIADALRDDIARKKMAPHTRLPSELELVRRYGAARETARRALAKLQDDGVVYRRQNVGTFVAEPRVDQDLDQLFSFTEYMMFRGLKPGSVHAWDTGGVRRRLLPRRPHDVPRPSRHSGTAVPQCRAGGSHSHLTHTFTRRPDR